MKKIVVGILAHVDAGKTTLSEAMLYQTGRIRKLGRVDHQDAFLDQEDQERSRGITIFSKQAVLTLSNTELMLLDTPGHVDFSSEMERTLQVLDYAILVISGSDGVQSHTRTLGRLLKRYQIPTFLFINKMDLGHRDQKELLQNIQAELSPSCLDFTENWQSQKENIAVADENVLENFLEEGDLSENTVRDMIAQRKIFPCYFGSALKLIGTERFMADLDRLTVEKQYPDQFGAKVYKIGHDPQGERITYLKITGGSLKVRDQIEGTFEEASRPESSNEDEPTGWKEKINQIRRYNGGRYITQDQLSAGMIGAVTGLTHTYPGMGLGIEKDSQKPLLDSFLTYQVLPDDSISIHTLEKYLRSLEEEDPQLHVVWNSQLAELHVQLMGKVQLEVLQKLMQERYHVSVAFGPGHIVYRETIRNSVEGVGHYAPLRHYAEVHLLLEPGQRGSGLSIQSKLSTDKLDKNYQHLILTHLSEKPFPGVLTGSLITDIRITLIGGAASVDHTVGGDFMQATWRAVRQGLMQADNILLEPWYDFELTVPESTVGKAITDLSRMDAVFSSPEPAEKGYSLIKGYAPVAVLSGYDLSVAAYTKGNGTLICIPRGYAPCHNTEEVIKQAAYDPTADLANSPDSIFCAHGAGFPVPWWQVPDYMHIETEYSYLHRERQILAERNEKEFLSDPGIFQEVGEENSSDDRNDAGSRNGKTASSAFPSKSASNTSLAEDKELRAIFERTYGPIKERQIRTVKRTYGNNSGKVEIKEQPKQTEYLLVDGYNIIFAWEELTKLSKKSLDLARTALADLMCAYQSVKGCILILVYDAYMVEREEEDVLKYHNIYVVYTKHAETADTYIERATYELDKNHRIEVATSDGAEQVIVMGHGAIRISAREFESEVKKAGKQLEDTIDSWNSKEKSILTHTMDHLLKPLAGNIPENKPIENTSQPAQKDTEKGPH